MLRVSSFLLYGALICLALQGCDWLDDCSVGALKCHGSVIEECEQTADDFGAWTEVGDCAEIDSTCVVEQGKAQCQYGPR